MAKLSPVTKQLRWGEELLLQKHPVPGLTKVPTGWMQGAFHAQLWRYASHKLLYGILRYVTVNFFPAEMIKWEHNMMYIIIKHMDLSWFIKRIRLYVTECGYWMLLIRTEKPPFFTFPREPGGPKTEPGGFLQVIGVEKLRRRTNGGLVGTPWF